MSVDRARGRRGLLPVAAAAALLAGCSSIEQSLGAGKQGPDEFRVVAKAPLVMPPDYSLRPPKPGEARPQELAPTLQARQALFPRAGTGEIPEPTPGEIAVLVRMGGRETDPNIREKLNTEIGVVDRGGDFASAVLFWPGPSDEAGEGDKPAIVRDEESEGFLSGLF